MNYYCSSCSKVHTKGFSMTEVVFKTGFTYILNQKMPVGNCK